MTNRAPEAEPIGRGPAEWPLFARAALADPADVAEADVAEVDVAEVDVAEARPARVEPAHLSEQAARVEADHLPTVSVVVPTYNRRAGLKRLLAALARQSHPASDFEVVVVDDGSTDDTPALLRGFRAPYHLVWHSQANSGPAAARNLGLRLARGRLLVFLDDDVEPLPDLIAAHVAAHGDAARRVVVGPMSPPRSWARPAWVRWEERQLEKQYAAMREGEYACTQRQFYTGNASLPRELVLAAGGFDARFKRAEDVELAWRLAGLGAEFAFEPRADVYHYAARGFGSWRRTPYQYGRYDVVMEREKGLQTLQQAAYEFHRRHRLNQRLARHCVGRTLRRRAVVAGLATVAVVADALRLERVASFALSGIFNLLYWQGASDELGGPTAVWRAVARPFGQPAPR